MYNNPIKNKTYALFCYNWIRSLLTVRGLEREYEISKQHYIKNANPSLISLSQTVLYDINSIKS